MRAALALAVGLVAGSVLGQAAPSAWASFQAQATAGAVIGADVLAPPTDVTVSPATCAGSSYSAVVSWTASSSTWLSAYEVQVATAADGPFSVVAPTDSTDTRATTRTLTGLARRTTYYVVVRSARGAWRTAAPVVALATGARAC